MYTIMFEQLPLSYYLSANTMTHVYQRKRHLGKHSFNNMIKILLIILLAKQVSCLWKIGPLCPINIIYHYDVMEPQAAIRSN